MGKKGRKSTRRSGKVKDKKKEKDKDKDKEKDKDKDKEKDKNIYQFADDVLLLKPVPPPLPVAPPLPPPTTNSIKELIVSVLEKNETPATSQPIYSGIWRPEYKDQMGLLNLPLAYEGMYQRIGDLVTASFVIKVTLDPSFALNAGPEVSIAFSLPVPRGKAFSKKEDLIGTASTVIISTGARAEAIVDSVLGKLLILGLVNTAQTSKIAVNFSYNVK